MHILNVSDSFNFNYLFVFKKNLISKKTSSYLINLNLHINRSTCHSTCPFLQVITGNKKDMLNLLN